MLMIIFDPQAAFRLLKRYKVWGNKIICSRQVKPPGLKTEDFRIHALSNTSHQKRVIRVKRHFCKIYINHSINIRGTNERKGRKSRSEESFKGLRKDFQWEGKRARIPSFQLGLILPLHLFQMSICRPCPVAQSCVTGNRAEMISLQKGSVFTYSHKTVAIFLSSRWGAGCVFLCRWVWDSEEQMGEPPLGLIVLLVKKICRDRFLMDVSFTSSMPAA